MDYQVGSGRNDDAAGSQSFLIEISGLTLGQFTSAHGLEMETEIIEYREGGNNDNALKFRGASRYPNITLERGFVASKELWEWYLQCNGGTDQMPRKDGSIVLVDSNDQDKEIARWNFYRGWPCRWVGPALNSQDSSNAVEVLEIAHERLEFKQGK
jgi:phage tail-like protein